MGHIRFDARWTFCGSRALVLESDLLRVVVLPDYGAKIWSILDKQRDREILWHHPRVDPRPAPYGAAYDDWFSGGWDELFPNDAPAEVGGERLPDHGELWSLPWEWSLDEQSDREVAVVLRRAGVATATRVEKRISLRMGEPLLRIGASIHNDGPQPQDFLWKLHPALRITPDSRIDIPARRVETDPGFRARLGDVEAFDWPYAPVAGGGRVDLRRIPPREAGACDFFYALELEQGWCALTDSAARAGFGLVFDPGVFRSVWVFGAYGGWRGLYTTILEPCTGWPYRLEDAVGRGTAGRIEAGGRLDTEITAVVYGGVEGVAGLTREGEVR